MRLLALLFILFCALPATAAEPLGEVVRIQGTADAMRDGTAVPLAEGTVVERGDVLRTGDLARLRVALRDGSMLTLGERAEMVLNDAVVPREGSGDGPFLELLSGAFRLVAAKVSQGGDRRVRTPVATIGIRGTDFWGGSLDNPLDVLVLEGAVAVTTDAGSVLLDQPGQGTHVAGPDVPPGPASRWAAPMVGRAVATITFDE